MSTESTVWRWFRGFGVVPHLHFDPVGDEMPIKHRKLIKNVKLLISLVLLNGTMVLFNNCAGNFALQGEDSGSSTESSNGAGGGGNGPVIPLPPAKGSPYVLFTDAVSGPTSGGENNLGAYLSIFGKNFGADLSKIKIFIGGVEVANYRFLMMSKTGTKTGIEHIGVQVGALGGAAQGVAIPIKVVVNGLESNADVMFTPNPGRILFVALDGDDSKAMPGDISKPYRHLQTADGGGAHGAMKAGDHVVIRGGNWSDIGFDGAWLRFRYPQQQGTVPNGKANSGWIHITAYPGAINGNMMEDVHYSTAANKKGGIHGTNSAYYGTTGDYVSISNLRIDVDPQATSDAAPFNEQYGKGPWRVVNNEAGPWLSTNQPPNNSKGAGFSGHGDGTKVYGNNFHDMGCTGAQENHGVYIDSGGMNTEIAYNWIHDISGGNLIQFFDNVGLAGNSYTNFPPNWKGFAGMSVHHNWMENSAKYGLNMADGLLTGQVFDNVVIGAAFSGLRINTISKNMDMTFAFNTFYDNDKKASGSGNGQVLNTWGNYNPTGALRIYDNIFAAGPHTIAGSDYYVNAGAEDNYLDFKRNLWFDAGHGWGGFGRDASGIFADPLFVDSAGADFHLQAASRAVDAGTQAIPFMIVNDFDGITARPQGPAMDIGAFELEK
jgi:hypothetical protein